MAVTACLMLPAAAWAGGNCQGLGLAPESRTVVQLREAGHGERTVLAFRDRARSGWFVPVPVAERSDGSEGDEASGSARCTFEGQSYRNFAAADPALRHDSDTDLLTVLDHGLVTDVIDARRPALAQSPALESAGVNYQLTLNYADNNPQRRLNPGAYADFYASTGGWYLSNSLAWSSNGHNGRIARYETYALREWLDTGTFLRLGDSVSNPTALGESLQFAGVSWGTDRNLRPGDFAPVLPTLRNGNALAGPLEVFVNDNLQFQQNLQRGVYDLRNLPAQQGFNSYSVRTLDAQGNAVTVQREIYLPVSLLPPGIAAWRVDAGFQREDFFTANANYGPGFVAGSYARGISHDVTLSAQGLVSRAASTLSAGYDQRLSDLWTGHLGLVGARNTHQHGHALQARIDGGSRWWRLLADWTHARRALPGLGTRPALLMQRLVRAQWNGFAGWSLGLTAVQTEREPSTREDLATLSATTRISQTGASMTLSLTRTRFSGLSQNNLMLSFFMPLAPNRDNRNRAFYASHNRVEGAQLSRAQYSDSGLTPQDSNWSLGATHDSRPGLSAIDGFWQRSIDKADLSFSGRSSRNDSSGQFALRSGVLWTGGSAYLTRPIRGAFAMVSTGEEGVDVFYENRPVGRTDARGMLLVPDLRALESNRLSLDPSTWPIHWLAGEVERRVVPPRGGGVLVSFRINAQVWPAHSMVTPLAPGGGRFPPGTVVRAVAEEGAGETVIDRQGRMWLAELLPARAFRINHAGKCCEFDMPEPGGGDADMTVQARQCEDIP